MTAVYHFIVAVSFVVIAIGGVPLYGDDPDDPKDPKESPGEFEWSDDVRDVLSPLFTAIKEADVSRATIEVLSDSLINGRVIDSKKLTYQIASIAPNKFTVYLKGPSQRTRIYNDGQSMIVAPAPNAFFRLSDPISNAQAVLGLPIPMGPYPEPVMALTLAGVDPAQSLASGMRSVEVVDKKEYRGAIPAVHLRGIQADNVIWDIWVSQTDPPKPLRMLVDLTPMLLAAKEFQLPQGYSHQIRFDFLSWRVTGKVDDRLFSFTPAENAKEYKSLDDYNESIATVQENSKQAETDDKEK